MNKKTIPFYPLLTTGVLVLAFSLGGLNRQTSKALTMDEVYWSQFGSPESQVLGQTVYSAKTLTSATNRSLKVKVTPIEFLPNGTWNYGIEWKRTLNRQGSFYVSLKANRNNKVLEVSPASQSGREKMVLLPDTYYRVEFYSKPQGQGTLLLRKYFITLAKPTQTPTPTPTVSPKPPPTSTPTPTPTSKIDNVYFVIPTTLAQLYPDYQERLAKMIQEVSTIFAKNTEKRFALKNVTLFDPKAFCDFTITTGFLQCERVFSYPSHQFSNAITVFVVPTDPNTSQGGMVNLDADLGGWRVRWRYYLGDEEMFNYTTDRGVIGSIAHEFGHTLALGSPELYIYDQLVADGTNVEPVLPTQNYLPPEYKNDPMGFSHTMNDQFGPLNVAIVNSNLDRTQSNAYFETAAYPKTVAVRIINSARAPVADAEVRTFCIMGRGGSVYSDYTQRYKTRTDTYGMALLRKVVSEELVIPDAFPYECSIAVLKVSKIGYQPTARAVTALELQEAKVLRKLEEYTIPILLSTPTPISTPTTSPVSFGKMGYILLYKNLNEASSERVEKLTKLKEKFSNLFFEATSRSATIDTRGPVYLVRASQEMLVIDSAGKAIDIKLALVLKEFYKTHQDNYNFISIHTTFPLERSAGHEIVNQSIKGIGSPIKDGSISFGSNGVLKGIDLIGWIDKFNTSDLETQLSLIAGTELHEFGHQWCCWVGDAFRQGANNVRLEIRDGNAHFYPGLQSPWREPMGALEWIPNSDGTFRAKQYDQNNPPALKYHPFALYFMGLLPESEYSKQYQVYNIGLNPIFPQDFQQAVYYKSVSVNDIIAVTGKREVITSIITQPPSTPQAYCTTDVILCPDGKTYVSRVPPSCEFAACPISTPTTSPTSEAKVKIRAYGTYAGGAYPIMELRAGEKLLQRWTTSSSPQDYTFATSGSLIENLRVYFTNDYYKPPADRNLFVDYISVNGVKYLSTDPSVYSTGTYRQKDGCKGGYKQSNALHCNGYFEYSATIQAASGNKQVLGIQTTNIFNWLFKLFGW